MNSRERELPPYQEGPAAWLGPDISERQSEWSMTLSSSDLAELENATEQFIATGIDLADMTSDAFPLRSLSRKFKDVRSALLDGLGHMVLRGLPADRYSQKEVATLFFGIGNHIGHARSQNALGHVLGHVRDEGKNAIDPSVRIYQTPERQTFHTDSCDVVGLLCLKTAKSGGDSLLVSAVTIFNKMRRRRPDLLNLLFDPVATDRRGEVPQGMKPFFLIPVFSLYAGHLTVMYQRQYIESAQRYSDAPRLTPAHVEALNLFDSLANDPALHLSMRLEPGDMQFVYNHHLLHDRTEFEDWPQQDRRRHLLRLWLSVPGDRRLQDCFAERFGTIEVGNRGGIIVPGTRLSAPLDVV